MGNYYSFNSYLKEKFGGRVHRLSVDGGFGCPNLDGTLSRKGCIFCNNKAFSYFSGNRRLSLEDQIIKSMEYVRRRYKAEKFIVYFQSFTNTYASVNILKEKYSIVRKFNNIVGIAISTRPDCINTEKLELINSFSSKYEIFIEYGLQTANDVILEKINRNHTFSDFEKAVELTARYKNIHIAVHIILGLPGERKEDMLNTAKILSKMPLWGLKFHCLHVVKDTVLEEMYTKRQITLLGEDEYIDILISFLELIPSEWVMLRLVSDSNRDLLIAPMWLNEKHRVLRKIEEEFIRRGTYQGRLYEGVSCKSS